MQIRDSIYFTDVPVHKVHLTELTAGPKSHSAPLPLNPAAMQTNCMSSNDISETLQSHVTQNSSLWLFTEVTQLILKFVSVTSTLVIHYFP